MTLREAGRKDYIRRRSIPEPNTGCWLWMGYVSIYGYGIAHQGHKQVRAHRLSYEAFVGPIPEGLDLDHLCRVTSCVNPDHLEAVTPQENLRRSNAKSAVNARKTHCQNGHPLSGENLYRKPRGERVCRQCRKGTGRVGHIVARALRAKGQSLTSEDGVLVPQVLCPRGIYEGSFYLFTVGTLVLFSVTSAGLLHRKKVVRTPEEYAKALAELTTALDAADPPDYLQLVD